MTTPSVNARAAWKTRLLHLTLHNGQLEMLQGDTTINDSVYSYYLFLKGHSAHYRVVYLEVKYNMRFNAALGYIHSMQLRIVQRYDES